MARAPEPETPLVKDHPSQWIDSGLACRDITNRATDYVEGRLSAFTKVKIGLHLASCPGCRDYVMQISLVKDTMALLCKQFPSPINRLHLCEHFVSRHSQ